MNFTQVVYKIAIALAELARDSIELCTLIPLQSKIATRRRKFMPRSLRPDSQCTNSRFPFGSERQLDPTVCFSSLTKGCSRSTRSAKKFFKRPSTILSTMLAGLPSAQCGFAEDFALFLDQVCGNSSLRNAAGRIAATCMQKSLASRSLPPWTAISTPATVPELCE